ncbi:MAG: hypothetical protein WBA51_00130 [Erythrobacter sp.]
MSYDRPAQPTFGQLYIGGLMASALTYLGIIVLIGISAAIGADGASSAFGLIFVGAVYMAIPAIIIALVISAPLGGLIGMALLNWLAPSQWHGAINGALTAFVLVTLTILAFLPFWQESLDAGTIAFTAGIIMVAAASGWIVQRTYLGWWPDPLHDVDLRAFD